MSGVAVRQREGKVVYPRNESDTKLHSKIEQGDQEDSDGGVLLVRRSRADAGNEAI